MVQAGLVVLDRGTTFGGGDLISYGINSNTSAAGFLKAMFKKEEFGGNLRFKQPNPSPLIKATFQK